MVIRLLKELSENFSNRIKIGTIKKRTTQK